MRRKKNLNLIDLLTAFDLNPRRHAFAKTSVTVKPKTGPDPLSFYRGVFYANPIPVHAKIILVDRTDSHEPSLYSIPYFKRNQETKSHRGNN